MYALLGRGIGAVFCEWLVVFYGDGGWNRHVVENKMPEIVIGDKLCSFLFVIINELILLALG